MAKKARGIPRREEALSRDRIIEASIELLDSSGEGGLTFRTLSERLATGPGAIYWHIASKRELLIAACDAIVARTMNEPLAANKRRATPQAIIRALALGMFDAIDAHPWVGSALIRAELKSPMIAHFRTHRPTGARSWRAGRTTVGNGLRVVQLHSWRRWEKRSQRAAWSDAGHRQIGLSGSGVDYVVAARSAGVPVCTQRSRTIARSR